MRNTGTDGHCFSRIKSSNDVRREFNWFQLIVFTRHGPFRNRQINFREKNPRNTAAIIKFDFDDVWSSNNVTRIDFVEFAFELAVQKSWKSKRKFKSLIFYEENEDESIESNIDLVSLINLLLTKIRAETLDELCTACRRTRSALKKFQRTTNEIILKNAKIVQIEFFFTMDIHCLLLFLDC